MSESVLRILLRLFASMALVDGVTREEKEVVARFLADHLNDQDVPRYMAVFEKFLAHPPQKNIRTYCAEIATELTEKQQFIILLHLLELVHADGDFSEGEVAFLDEIADAFVLPNAEAARMIAFVGAASAEEIEGEHLLLVSDEIPPADVRRRLAAPVEGTLLIASLSNGSLYLVKYFGSSYLQLNHQYMQPGHDLVLSHGSVISLPHGNTLYFSDIVGAYLDLEETSRVRLQCRGLEFDFPNGNKGLRGVDLAEESGRMVAIMGASGSGKSTLLNVLNGNYRPARGEVLVNGDRLHDNLDKYKGLIGYVPQDDLLVEELTVYQNLYFNARLCHRDLDHAALDALVIKVLADLGLSETRDLRVGNPMDKTISGGQRKRLNIGLELLRAPAIIFFDEPTSGLSSRDSENIMDLLKELTFKGKLIFVVIHQPSSEIFKMFDSLFILDTGGYPIYYGNPVEAVMYFKRVSEQLNHGQAACPECGNINPEQIFNIIETRVIDEYGQVTNQRRITPERWHKVFVAEIGSPVAAESPPDEVPLAPGLKTPSWARQFAVFWRRDLLAKLGNKQYMTINLLQAPLLAFILAILVRHSHAYSGLDQHYIFSKNENIPAFFFMSIVVSLFIGMTMSAEEIFRDRKILKRETFLNLSRSGYLLAKTSILFGFSSLQMLVFVLISSLVLALPGLYWEYWLLLFSLSCFAILLGLNISATFNSAVTIYILIPLMLIPQLILSGTVVKFDQLNPGFSSPREVPVAADLMASRWAYEAMMVKFFKDNAYEREFYAADARASAAVFRKDYWLPEMVGALEFCELHVNATAAEEQEEFAQHLSLLENEVYQFQRVQPDIAFVCGDGVMEGRFSDEMAACYRKFFGKVKAHYVAEWKAAKDERNAADAVLAGRFADADAYTAFREAQHNEAVEKLVRNSGSGTRLLVRKDELVRTYEPVYYTHPPRGLTGYRTHFYAPSKTMFGMRMDTFWFNLLVIWGMTLVLYGMLYYRVFRRVLRGLQGIGGRFRRK